MLLEGKVAVVTGSGRGIGREHALLLARHGAKVVVNDLGAHFDGGGQPTNSPAQEVVAEIKAMGGDAIANGENVTDFAGAKRIIECAFDSFGKLNIVVNNAGILRDRVIFNMSEEDWDTVIAVHLKGSFNMARHACVYWREEHKAGRTHNGRIINTSSDAGLLGNGGQGNYGSAKAALACAAVIWAGEMRKYGVTVNAIAPVAKTRLTTDATPSTAAFMGDERFDPKYISPLVCALSTDQAGSITGQVFRVVGKSVWLMQGWHSVARLDNEAEGPWDPEVLEQALETKLAEGLTTTEDIMQVLAGGI